MKKVDIVFAHRPSVAFARQRMAFHPLGESARANSQKASRVGRVIDINPPKLLRILSTLFLVLNPAAAFNPSSPNLRVPISISVPDHHRSRATSMSMDADAADASVDLALQQVRKDRDAREDAAELASARIELIKLMAEVERGAIADDKKTARIVEIVEQLEKANLIPQPLASPLLSSRWQLLYTTSRSILGLDRRMTPQGPIYQTIDVPNLKARNDETVRWASRRFPWFGKRFSRFVEADLEPLSESKVKVKFRRFGIGPLIRIPAPPSAIGELDTTYLDDELRISRGDRGNLFVLQRDNP